MASRNTFVFDHGSDVSRREAEDLVRAAALNNPHMRSQNATVRYARDERHHQPGHGHRHEHQPGHGRRHEVYVMSGDSNRMDADLHRLDRRAAESHSK